MNFQFGLSRTNVARFCVLFVLSLTTGCSQESPPSSGKPSVESNQVDTPVKPIVVLTYNVLADPMAGDQRVNAILEVIREGQPDIIALQEADSWFLKIIESDSRITDHYRSTWKSSLGSVSGGQHVLSRYPIRDSSWVTLTGRQRRTALIVTLDVDGREMVLATTHMESPLDAGPVRAQQLDEIFRLIGSADESILLGDLNFGDGEKEEAHIPSTFTDCWLALHPEAPGFTWNMESSAMAKRGSFPSERSRRLDRVLVRSRVYEPASIRIVGDQPIDAALGLFPSDHFGLLAKLKPRD